jgi:hypothetical protein
MNRWTALGCVVAMTLMPMVAPRADAQCVDETFDEFGVDTPITSQIDGVTIVVAGQSCGGDPALHMRVADEWYGDSFVSDVLLIDGGCPDFSSDYIRMIFDDLQTEVRFLLGPWAGTYSIRAYSASVGGTPVLVKTVAIPGSGFVDVRYPVLVRRSVGDIRRIEIEADGAGWEAIDDLRFGRDVTAPLVQVDQPLALSCVSGAVSVNGVVCDEDGAYDRDRLEYLSTWAVGHDRLDADSGVRRFTRVRSGDPVRVGHRHRWRSRRAPRAAGDLEKRVRAECRCRRAGAGGQSLRHRGDPDARDRIRRRRGAVRRRNGDRHRLLRPLRGGLSPEWWIVVSSQSCDSHPWHTGDRRCPRLLVGLPGAVRRQLRAVGDRLLGHRRLGQRHGVRDLDKTLPTIQFTNPTPGSLVSGVVTVTGTASDEHIHEWSLEVFDPDTGDWIYLGDDSDSIVDGFLGTWDTTGFPYCAATLRLRVVEGTMVGCAEAAERRVTETFLPVTVAMFADDFESGTTASWSGTTP